MSSTPKPPRINLCFSGWIKGANVYRAYDPKTGSDLDVTMMDSLELVQKLQNGELAISLELCLNNCDGYNIEFSDIETT